jgi:hypothetical protein
MDDFAPPVLALEPEFFEDILDGVDGCYVCKWIG